MLIISSVLRMTVLSKSKPLVKDKDKDIEEDKDKDDSFSERRWGSCYVADIVV